MRSRLKLRRTYYSSLPKASHAAVDQRWPIGVWSMLARVALVVLVLCLLLLNRPQPLFASTSTGADPAHPLFPTAAWLPLANGAGHWYAFRDEGDDTSIVVRMTVIPEHSASFSVLTAAAVRQWARGEELVAVGQGSELKLFNNDLYWTGSFVQSGTYYVLVRSEGQGASNYQLTINGSGVSFPLRSFSQPNNSPTESPPNYPVGNRLPPDVSPTLVAKQPLTDTGVISSAENPLPPIGKLMSIAGDDVHWYAFRDEGDASSIQVRADATPDNCLSFGVWTPEQLTLWQQGEEVRPVGQGTPNLSLKADLFWTGSFVKSGIYYIVARHDPAVQGLCNYKLTVLGDDVSLVMPAPRQR